MATVTGRLTINGVEYLEVASDPSAGGGTVAPAGSIASVSDGSGVWIKNSATDTDWTQLASGLSGSGSSGKLAYWSGANTLAFDTDLNYDNTNNRLGVGSAATYPLTIGSNSASGRVVSIAPGSLSSADAIVYTTGSVTGSLYPLQSTHSATSGLIAYLSNTSTNAAAKTELQLLTASGGGDPQITMGSGGTSWYHYVDQSDSSTYKIKRNATDYVFIKGDGYVGLQTFPDYKMHIKDGQPILALHDTNTGLVVGDVWSEMRFLSDDVTGGIVGSVKLTKSSALDNSVMSFHVSGGTAGSDHAVLTAGGPDAWVTINALSTEGSGEQALAIRLNDTSITSGQDLPKILFGTYDGSSATLNQIKGTDYFGAVIETFATGNWSTGNVQPTGIRFLLQDDTATNVLTSSTPAVTFRNNGRVGIGKNAGDTTWALEIDTGSSGGALYNENSILLNGSDVSANSEVMMAWQMQGPAGMGSTRWLLGMNEAQPLTLHRTSTSPTVADEVMRIDVERPTLGSGTSIPDAFMRLRSDGYVGLYLEADVDNAGGESVPYIYMDSDGGAVQYYMGGVADNTATGVGNTADATQNSFLIGTLSAYDMELCASGQVHMRLNTSGELQFINWAGGDQICVAWASIAADGTPTANDSFGFQSPSVSGSSLYLDFSSGNTRPTANYCVVIAEGNSSSYRVQVLSQTTTRVTLECYGYNNTTNTNWSSYNANVFVAVFDSY